MSSTIYLDVVELETPIYFDKKSREQFWPDDPEFKRLLKQRGLEKDDLEKCNTAIRLMDASGCTMLDPFPSTQKAFCWLREHIKLPHTYVGGALKVPENQKEVFGTVLKKEKVWAGWPKGY